VVFIINVYYNGCNFIILIMFDLRTNLFIIKQQDSGDLDRIITVFTEDYGKKIIKLKSCYKFLSKLNSNLQFFSIANCDIVVGKNFDKICNASVEKTYDNMFLDLRKNIAYMFVCEIVQKQMDFHFSDKRVYNLCIGYFDFINNMKLKDCQIVSSIDFIRDRDLIKILYGFVVNFLKINGVGVVFPNNKILNKEDFFKFVYNNIERDLEIEKFFN